MKRNEPKDTDEIPEKDMVNWLLSIAEKERKKDDPQCPMLVGGSTSPHRRYFWLLGDGPPQKLSSRSFGAQRRKAIASGYKRQGALGYPSLSWDPRGQDDSCVDVCYEKGIFWFTVKPNSGAFEYFASWARLYGRGSTGIISIQNGKQICRLTGFSIS